MRQSVFTQKRQRSVVIRPILKKPRGKVLFAGEHLADWQGFMEGAIETGEAAAASLIR